MYISYNEKIENTQRKLQNEKYIQQKLIEEKEYFDNMFKNIDNNIKLDENQRRIILTDEKYLMVIAGAGSGKTTTISAKVNYLIEKQNIKDDEIIVISFTNKAVEELNLRINKDFNHKVKVTTFHKLGYEIIKQNCSSPPKIISENNIIKDYIEKEVIKNPKILKTFIDLYTYYFNISEEMILFQNYDKYKKYKNKQEYPTLKSKIDYIKKETVNNIKERQISDFLYIHNINYEYKKEYPYLKKYKPDFTIYNKDKIYYIEIINIETIKKYKNEKAIRKLRNIHKKYKTNLIEIYNDDTLEKLELELRQRKISLKEKNLDEIFDKLIKNQDQTYKKFINFCTQFISLYKAKGYKINDFEKIKYQEKRSKIFKEFIEQLYKYYQRELENRNLIDFDDIINKASEKIKNAKKNLKYKYIIIDEYQDISECRFKLIKNIDNKINTKIMVVGDDWQCIYSFASSNINLFTNFKNTVEYCETLKILKTYRNSQELIDIAGKFIQENKNQIQKKLVSDKNIKNPITILTYKTKHIRHSLKEALDYIIKKYGLNKTILILGRYTFDKNKILDENIILKQERIIYKKYPEQKIEYMTIHASKGLGYDNVILINAIDDILGFPSKIKIDPILKPLITIDTKKYSEERRLFYVALTRTKNEIIILTPEYNSSKFVKEIKKHKNVRIKHNKIK